LDVTTLIKPGAYHDSVALMLVARELARMPDVSDAAVVMGTQANKAILKQAALLSPAAEEAGANDLVIVFKAPDGSTAAVLSQAERLLQGRRDAGAPSPGKVKSVRAAVKTMPKANVAVISVGRRFASSEAWEALRHGLHVLLFSDGVGLEDEIALKQYARDHHLLMMGPGAGTAFVNGVGLGFANVLPAGPVGIVAAAGTGLQEVASLLAWQGIGISQGLGVGGRDVTKAVGGIMMLEGLKALQDDPGTKAIVLVSKPPSREVVNKVMEQVALGVKPTVVCFLGGLLGITTGVPHLVLVRTLQQAALFAAQVVDPGQPDPTAQLMEQGNRLARRAARLRRKLRSGQRYLRGLYSGGTLCYEAQVVWHEMLDAPVFSNAPLRAEDRLPSSTRSRRHTALDLGEEEFTEGRLHPMIDNDLRIRRLKEEVADPHVAVIVMDVVLGYGAHPDPASKLAPAIRTARQRAKNASRELVVIASVTGTDSDPQGFARQSDALAKAGANICSCNAEAAQLAGLIVQGRK
jgi:FdrA protein